MTNKTFKAIVEIPKGSKRKSEINALGKFNVVRKVKKGFIANYGRIPCTLAEDHSQVDIFILGKRLNAGKEIDAKIHSMCMFIDNGMVDNKIIGYQGKFTLAKKYQAKKLGKFLLGQVGAEQLASMPNAARYIERQLVINKQKHDMQDIF